MQSQRMPGRNASPTVSNTIKVENLPQQVNEEMLHSIFDRYGRIASLKLNVTGKALNFAYINYVNEEDADNAVQQCNNMAICGTAVSVKLKLHKPSVSNVGSRPPVSHADPRPSVSPVGHRPSVSPVGLRPSVSPVGPRPSVSPVGLRPSVSPVGPRPSVSPVGPRPSVSPVGPGPTFQHAGPRPPVSHADPRPSVSPVGPRASFQHAGPRPPVSHADPRPSFQHVRDRPISQVDQRPMQPGSTVQYTVKVDHLPPHVTEEGLKETFVLCGTVESVKIVRSHNYAYINYTKLEDARKAIERFNGSNFFSSNPISVKMHTSEIHVSTAMPRSINKALSIPANTPSTLTAKVVLPSHQTPTSASVTIKVSILTSSDGLKITPEDLDDLFGRFEKGQKLNQFPDIKPGNPPYAYINYTTPEAARAAASELNGTILHTHLIKVKVHAANKPQLDIRKIECRSLVGKLLFSDYKSEFQNIPEKVTVKPNKSYTTIKVSGEADQLGIIEMKVRDLVKRVDKDIKKVPKSLPHFHLPSFGSHQIEDMIKQIEDKHIVHIRLIDCNGNHLDVGDIMKQISYILHTNGEEAVEIMKFSNFLHTVTSESPPSQLLNQLSSITLNPVVPARDHVWYWENDSKSYSLYSQDHSKQLTKNLLTSPRTPFLMDIQQTWYWIDLSEMTQTNTETGNKRRIKLDIQRSSESGPRIHFPCTTSALTVQPTQAERHRRHICIEIEGLKSCIDASFGDLTDELQKWVTESKCILNKVDPIAAALLDTTNHYCVEATVVGLDLFIKGTKEYVDKVTLVVQKECMKFLQQKIQPRPDHWAPQTEKALLIDIRPTSTEWNNVVFLMQKTLPEARVIILQRIQNEWLWTRYALAMQRMSDKNGQHHVNEKYLFHGTGATPPEKIYRSEQGFDFRYSTGDNLWGAGSYFAVNAGYSNTYSYGIGNKRSVILAHVLTGEACSFSQPDRTLKKPPCKPYKHNHFEDELYDSVTGNINGSDIYVIYDHEKAYPAYLITYYIA